MNVWHVLVGARLVHRYQVPGVDESMSRRWEMRPQQRIVCVSKQTRSQVQYLHRLRKCCKGTVSDLTTFAGVAVRATMAMPGPSAISALGAPAEDRRNQVRN